ncbi:MAG: XdhC family protein [Rhodospirillales bacterium]|nr:XdhC family protein [Rhodospirillales bacterium]
MKRDLLATLLRARRGGSPAVLVTRLSDGEQMLVKPEGEGSLAAAFSQDVVGEAQRSLAVDQSRIYQSAADRVFLHVFNPAPRLIVVGAVHIAEPLVRMAGSAGYAITLIDPRRAFAAREQFRDFVVVDAWPDEAIKDLNPDARTAVVTLTHDPKLDDAALLVALSTPAFYIGCLGSRKTHAARLVRLRNAGVGDEELTRIHGPIGLSIGARTPAEIAVSILAEITQVRRGRHDT